MLNKGVDFIAITDNEKEINVIERGDKTKIPVPAIDAVDTLGAGDVLHGAFCYYLAEGLTKKEALSRAALIASRSCCYFGTHTFVSCKASSHVPWWKDMPVSTSVFELFPEG